MHSLDSLNIPEEHIPFLLNSHSHVRKRYCSSSSSPYCDAVDLCWGYEKHCDDPAKRYFPPSPCPGDSRSWASTKAEQQEQFFLNLFPVFALLSRSSSLCGFEKDAGVG